MATTTVTRRLAVQHCSQPPQSNPGDTAHAVLDLSALPTAPGRARRWARQVIRSWRLAGLSDTAEVIVSELTTNAVLASRPLGRRLIRLFLTLDRGELVILVRDYCPSAPQPRNAGDEDENGRGLLLVEAMSGRSGWYRPGDGSPGKVVWAALPG